MSTIVRIGCCITSHGFGHAARACSVLEALHRIMPVHFEIITMAPPWILRESLSASYTLHQLESDIGLVQKNPLEEDLAATLSRLAEMFPPSQQLLDRLGSILSGCSLVLCDISAVAVVAAARAGVPSLLLENFTWDWIYSGYREHVPDLTPYINMLQEMYGMADYHVQAIPVCSPRTCDLVCSPVSRAVREDRQTIRQKLGLLSDRPLVLITMGGIDGADFHTLSDALQAISEVDFIVPGSCQQMRMDANLILLPCNSGFFHPDLVGACNAVIGKVGYSTLAEVYQSGSVFGYIQRPSFPESAPLSCFIEKEMSGMDCSEAYCRGEWSDLVRALLQIPRQEKNRPNGAEEVARFIASIIVNKSGTIKSAAVNQDEFI